MRDDHHHVDLTRISRVAELRERIATSTYRVDPQAVAQALIQRLLTRPPAAWSRRPGNGGSADVLEAG